MTIAQAFNDIAIAQGGNQSTSGSIADAIDALNDALAGSDQASAQTIEDAVRLLGQNIGGGGGGETEYSIKCYDKTGAPIESMVYSATLQNGETGWSYDVDTSSTISKATPGTFLAVDMTSYPEEFPYFVNAEQDVDNPDFKEFPEVTDGDYKVVTMPAQDVFVYIADWL